MQQPHEAPHHGPQGRNLFVPKVTRERESSEGYKVGLFSTILYLKRLLEPKPCVA